MEPRCKLVLSYVSWQGTIWCRIILGKPVLFLKSLNYNSSFKVDIKTAWINQCQYGEAL